jgi:hypothetical protein
MAFSQLIAIIAVADPGAPTELTTWQTANPLAIISSIQQRNQVWTIFYTLSASANVTKTGTLTTTAITADQVVLTYTVTAGTTFYLTHLDINTHLTVFANNIFLGAASLESPAGTKLITTTFTVPNPTTYTLSVGTPIPIPSGTVIRVVCTPATTTSTVWITNLGGYEL